MQGVEEDVLHDGFALTMRAEYFDLCGGERSVMAKGKVSKTKKVKPFPFKACVTGDKEIRVTCPLLSWTDRGNDDFKIKEQFHEDKYAKFLEGLDVSRNAFIQRAGKDKYETMEKIYVLRLIETSTTLIKLDATVLECNKKAAKKSHLSDPGLLRALAMNLNVDISSESDTFFREIEVSDQTYTLWEVAQAPRLLWQVANVAKQGRRVGDIEEDVDSDESEDDIVYQMKKANIGNRVY